MTNKTVDLSNLFASLQSELEAKLRSGQNIRHPGSKGDNSEVNWIEMLRQYLPKRYQIEKAFVVDASGSISDQLDAVIFDAHYSPPIFHSGGTVYVPAESVYAVLEVKQDLGKENLDYASEKAASVRRLKRTSAPITHAGGTYLAKTPMDIIAGILTFRCGWKSDWVQNVERNIAMKDSLNKLDIGCCLDSGAFVVENGVLNTSKKEFALAAFVWSLIGFLQAVGTAPALEVPAYSKSLFKT